MPLRSYRRQESMYAMTGLYSETGDDSSVDVPQDSENSESNVSDAKSVPNHVADTVIKCHSRQPSSGLVDQRDHADDDLSRDCGILGCRPSSIQKFARIKVRSRIDTSFACHATISLTIFHFRYSSCYCPYW